MPEPYGPGDFVWCRFPYSEAPDRPGPERHVGYIVDIAAARRRTSVAATLYTTTSWRGADHPLPLGLIPIPAEQAQILGQRPFVIDARRIAYMPLAEPFFPEIGKPGGGILGCASAGLQTKIERALVELLRRPDLLQLLGPDVPPSGRR